MTRGLITYVRVVGIVLRDIVIGRAASIFLSGIYEE
jgi:hypothetical protein